MKPARRAAVAAAALLLSTAAVACELVLATHPQGRELKRIDLDRSAPGLRIAFVHSVLGTPVEDRYRFRHGPDGWRAHLVEERFTGDGYGLPHTAGPGERLLRDGEGWRLHTDRQVHPLVVRALADQQMRLLLPGREPLPLATLGAPAVALRAEHCPND